MRIYVVTETGGSRGQRARWLLLRVVTRLVVALMWMGQLATMAAGAVDALAAAWLGVPSIARCTRLVAEAVRESGWRR